MPLTRFRPHGLHLVPQQPPGQRTPAGGRRAGVSTTAGTANSSVATISPLPSHTLLRTSRRRHGPPNRHQAADRRPAVERYRQIQDECARRMTGLLAERRLDMGVLGAGIIPDLLRTHRRSYSAASCWTTRTTYVRSSTDKGRVGRTCRRPSARAMDRVRRMGYVVGALPIAIANGAVRGSAEGSGGEPCRPILAASLRCGGCGRGAWWHGTELATHRRVPPISPAVCARVRLER